jgi:hypothetical protein
MDDTLRLAIHPQAARLLAVEVLLADPESLGDDVLESCLYLLRERTVNDLLHGGGDKDDEREAG